MGFLSLFFFFIAVRAVQVLPSNNSLDLSGSSYFRIWGSSHLNSQHLAPLTQYLLHLSDNQQKAFDISGSVEEVTAQSPFGLQSSQIACIPCDPSYYSAGNLDAGETLDYVVSQTQTPAAVILYSNSATHCSLTTDAWVESYPYIFTLIGENSAAVTALQKTFNAPNKTVNIIPMSTINPTDYSGGDAGGGGGNSPNTAMIILYSITGIITALFLAIIITGAVRAHRHPERYGPRRVVGRPRQSRARGIARAMLETIPIVKFNDDDGVDAAKQDVEMASSDDPNHEHSPVDSQEHVGGQTAPRETEMRITEQTADRPSPAPQPKTDAVPEVVNFSCPICTDDFVKGQDLRVLPCNHQFHPECVDPWLINVSGTCPLCRIDLNPPQEEAGEEGENAENAGETAADGTTTPAGDVAHGRHGHRLTNYLNLRRMHNASVEERIAALRRVRQANQDQAAEEASHPSRSRLTTRLRERFRIRTRAHGIESNSPDESGTVPTPAQPTPEHTA